MPRQTAMDSRETGQSARRHGCSMSLSMIFSTGGSRPTHAPWSREFLRPIQTLPARSANGEWNSAMSGFLAGSSTIGSLLPNGRSITASRCASTSRIKRQRKERHALFSLKAAQGGAGGVLHLIAPAMTAAVNRGAGPNSPSSRRTSRGRNASRADQQIGPVRSAERSVRAASRRAGSVSPPSPRPNFTRHCKPSCRDGRALFKRGNDGGTVERSEERGAARQRIRGDQAGNKANSGQCMRASHLRGLK